MNIGEKGARTYGAHAMVTWAALAAVISSAQLEAEEEEAPVIAAAAASSPAPASTESSSSSSTSPVTPQGDGDQGAPGAQS